MDPILVFELAHPAAGGKDAAIRAEFGIPPARYYQKLNALLNDAAALADHPTEVYRLRAIRDARVKAHRSGAFR